MPRRARGKSSSNRSKKRERKPKLIDVRTVAEAIDLVAAGKGSQVNWGELAARLDLRQGESGWIGCYRFLYHPKKLEDFDIKWDASYDSLDMIFDEKRVAELRAGAKPTAKELEEFKQFVAQEEHGWVDPWQRLGNYDCWVADLYKLGDRRRRIIYVLEVSHSAGEDFFGCTTSFKADDTMGFATRDEAEQWLSDNGEWANFHGEMKGRAWIVPDDEDEEE